MADGQKKVFLGFAISSGFLESFATCISEIQTQLAAHPMRYIAQDNYHMTLLYLGWRQSSEVENLGAQLAHFSCASVDLPAIRYAWMGNFSPRALTLEFSPAPLKPLIAACNAHFVEQQLAIDADSLRPHLTFARYRDKVGDEKLIALQQAVAGLVLPTRFLHVDRLILFESVMQNGHVTYQPLHARAFH